MVRIFGKSRKELLNARKFRKYLAYAVGEIILVVVGILIALQFNNADLDRQDRKKEKDFMVSMLGDLEKDVGEIDIAVAGNRVLLDGLDELLQMIAQPPQNLEEQRRLYLWSLKVEARQKDLFDLSLGKKAFELIEKDVRNMLLPAEQFQNLIEEGAYLVDSAPETLTAYYADVLYYRTTINNTNAAYAAQKDLAGWLSQLIRDNYDIE